VVYDRAASYAWRGESAPTTTVVFLRTDGTPMLHTAPYAEGLTR
jgi:hypothetical protein